MPVKREKDGQRYVEAEAEVPGSPEEVWRAIATGKGISSWFVPSTVEEREGGSAVSSFGPGMDSVAKITKWNPPHDFSMETQEEPGKVATEWTVETRAGGTCIVRVVHRWFARTDDWDQQFEGHTYGWAAFFRILKLYLAHFSGQACSAIQLSAFSKGTGPETWRMIMSGLAMDERARRIASKPGTPELSGAVESVGVEAYPELLLLLDRPTPGLAHLFVMPLCGPMMVCVRFYLYGDRGAAAEADVRRAWSDWLGERFPQEAPG